MESKERNQAFEARQEELESIASDLRKLAHHAWKKPAAFGLGLTGATWTLIKGDSFGAAFTAAGALLGLSSASSKVETGVYSYLFSAHSNYP